MSIRNGERHVLVINQRRDLRASCTCGRWSLTACTLDSDTDDQIDARAAAQHETHAEAAQNREKGKRS